MIIAVFGPSACSYAVSHRLTQESNVSQVIHIGASEVSTFPKIVSKVFRRELNYSPNGREFWIDEAYRLTEYQVDLAIATTIGFQMWERFQQIVANQRIPLLCPSVATTFLETRKSEAKVIFQELGIPTPKYKTLSVIDAVKSFYTSPTPFVIKFDSITREGMQTFVIKDESDRVNMHDLFDQTIKSISNPDNVIVTQEEFLQGSEYSYHVLCNGKDTVFFGNAKDYKRKYNGDSGPNTFGMGSISPVPFSPVVHTYAEKIVNYLNSQGMPYVGFLYLGILECNGIPYLLEVNTRPGDPEIQSILPTIDSNLSTAFYNAATGNPLTPIEFNCKKAASIRLLTKKTYFEYVDFPAVNLPEIPDNVVYQPVTSLKNTHSVFTAVSNSTKNSVDQLIALLDQIKSPFYTYRTDIGQ